MTVQEMQRSDKVFLLATDVAPVLQCDPHWIRLTARHNPERLGFPVTVTGTRTRIPRIPFLRFIGAEQ